MPYGSGVGFLSWLLRGEALTPALDGLAVQGEQFDVTAADVPAGFFGMTSYPSTPALAGRIDRASAMQVPAVKRARDLIAGTLATLPLQLFGPGNVAVVPDWAQSVAQLSTQPERHTPRSVTLARTFEDLLFEGVAWWLITDYGWHTYPTEAVRLDPRTVSMSTEGRLYITRDGNTGQAVQWVEDRDIIRFDSPNDPLLVAGARAIRTCLRLDEAASNMSDGTPPVDYFTPADDIDMPDDDVRAILNGWQEARRKRATGYVPAALKYNISGWSPEQLQLADARQHAVLEIAREAGISPEYLGVSTTSRTYANAQDERRHLIDFTLAGYMRAFEERLSMPDVTPRGYSVRFNLSDFMRSDDQTRMTVAAAGKAANILTEPEARTYFDDTLPAAIEAAPATEDTAHADV